VWGLGFTVMARIVVGVLDATWAQLLGFRVQGLGCHRVTPHPVLPGGAVRCPYGGLRTFHQKLTCLHVINLKALCVTNLVTLPPKFWGNETFVVLRVVRTGCTFLAGVGFCRVRDGLTTRNTLPQISLCADPRNGSHEVRGWV